jgi:hypothetical protein
VALGIGNCIAIGEGGKTVGSEIGIHALFADGRVLFLSKETKGGDLRTLISRHGDKRTVADGLP